MFINYICYYQEDVEADVNNCDNDTMEIVSSKSLIFQNNMTVKCNSLSDNVSTDKNHTNTEIGNHAVIESIYQLINLTYFAKLQKQVTIFVRVAVAGDLIT